MVIKLLMASDIMIRLSSTVSVGCNLHMVCSGAGDVGSGGAGDDDEMSWSHVRDTASYDGDMGLKNDGSGDGGGITAMMTVVVTALGTSSAVGVAPTQEGIATVAT